MAQVQRTTRKSPQRVGRNTLSERNHPVARQKTGVLARPHLRRERPRLRKKNGPNDGERQHEKRLRRSPRTLTTSSTAIDMTSIDMTSVDMTSVGGSAFLAIDMTSVGGSTWAATRDTGYNKLSNKLKSRSC